MIRDTWFEKLGVGVDFVERIRPDMMLLFVYGGQSRALY